MGKIRNMKLRYKVAAAVASGAIVLGAGGAAFAYWTSTGSGAGSAKTGTEVSSLAFTDTTNITDMAPGIAPETISGSVQNTSATQSAFVNSVTATINTVTETPAELAAYGTDGRTPGTSGQAYLCSAADYTISTTPMSVNKDLAPGDSANFTGATIGFNDNASVNQDACQGATVALTYTSN
jgi:hypothetical protein